MTLAKDVTGDTWSVHAKKKCVSPCPFHSPSDHALKDAPIHLRADKMMLVERMCEHGVGHDDPDSVAYFHSKGEMWAGTHGCDGCCTTEPMTLPDDIEPVESGELREQLAAIEHERWADWQKWCHKVLRENNPSPEQGDILERWDRQIETPYAELSEAEKQSDRDQVDRYWQLVEAYLAQEKAKWVSQMEQVIGEDDEVPPRPTGKEYLTRSQRTAVSKNVLRAKQRQALAKLLDKENV